MMIMFTGIGVLFTLIGVGVIIGGLVQRNSIKNSREVNATIVENIETKRRRQGDKHDFGSQTVHGTVTYYTPVYEYYDGGEVKRYKSTVSSTSHKPVGTEETLYIDRDGKVRSKAGSSFMFLFGGVFALVGVVFAVVSLILQGGMR